MKKARLKFSALTPLLTLGLILGVNCLFAQGIWKSYTVEDGLAHNFVWCINQDKEGNMWFGTKKGLSKLDTNGVWTSYLTEYVIQQLNEIWIKDIEIDSLNNKWFVAAGDFRPLFERGTFVVMFNDSNFVFYDPVAGIEPQQVPVCVGQDSTGSIWVGMQDNYAWRFDGQQWHPFYICGTFIYDTITDIKTDRNGTLYFAHGSGISNLIGCFWNGVNTWIEIWRITFDKQNRMWCAAPYNGLRMLQLEPFQWTFYNLEDGLLSNSCATVAVDSNNLVWIGFPWGAQRFDGKNWLTFTVKNGLIQHEVSDIFVEPNGDIWFGTAGGVSVFHDTTNVTKISLNPLVPDPEQFRLYPNFPNPFNSTTRIRYGIRKSEQVKYSIFNNNAQLITTLVNEVQQPGLYDIIWNSKDNLGKEVSSGIYFGVLQVGVNKTSQKMLLIR